MTIFQYFFISLVALSIAMAKAFTDEPAASEEIFKRSPRVLVTSLTCDKYPLLCQREGSTRPDCCNKKCVDITTDRLNCGSCGYKCKYTEICCEGQCMNAQLDKTNCGGCGIKCEKGTSCVYGLCNYA